MVLTVAVRGSRPGKVLPQVQILDASQHPIAVKVLVDGAGGYTIQAAGLAPGQTYYLKLTPPSSPSTRTTRASRWLRTSTRRSALMPVLATGNVQTAAPPPTYALYVALDQVFNFTLSAAGMRPRRDPPSR